MKLGKLDIELFYSVKAMMDIQELVGGGDLKKISEWINAEDISETEQIIRIVKIITILANAKVIRDNQEIALGLADGEKKSLYSDELFQNYIGIADLEPLIREIAVCLGADAEISVPDNIKMQEEDETLAEIEELKNQ
jgi:hypothetical protein